MWLLLFGSVFLLIAFSQANEPRVTEQQCKRIRENAQRWKPCPLDPYHDADLVSYNLYLGNVCAAHNDSWLEEKGITAVISMSREWSFLPYRGQREIAFHYYPLLDSTSENEGEVRMVLGRVASLINDLIAGGGDNRVLVHCNMGISRSSAAVLFYLQQYYMSTYSYQHIENFVKVKRPVIKPNSLYRKILLSRDLNHVIDL